jgi:molecular chaperone DnaJ
MGTENFYQVLGVDENATQDDIKKSYRKKAIEHHPDKGGNEETFKKISEAYDVLGNEDKRRQYDNQKNNPFGGFGGGNPFDDFFNSGYQTRRRTVPDTVIDITVGALESYNASDKTITYSRKHGCNTCNGTGGDKKTCTKCNGGGYTTVTMGTGLFTQMFRQPCNDCRGEGQVFKTRCAVCNGSSTSSDLETIKIKLPHGVDDGQFFKMQGNGDYNNGMYGNLVIRVKMAPEGNFEKSGNDLVYNAYLTLEDLSNDNLEIPHPSGNISIKIPEDFDTSKPLRVKSKGFRGNGVGDLFVKLFVKFKRTKNSK